MVTHHAGNDAMVVNSWWPGGGGERGALGGDCSVYRGMVDCTALDTHCTALHCYTIFNYPCRNHRETSWKSLLKK